MSAITNVTIETVDVALRHAFATSRDHLARRLSRMVRITLDTARGVSGVGECVPVQYVTGETQESAAAALRLAGERLRGLDCMRPLDLLGQMDAFVADAPSARAALEMAVYDAFCGLSGLSWWSFFGGAVEEVTTDVTLPLVDDVVERTRAHANLGFRCFKVKVGRPDAESDLAVLREVHRATPDATFRIDANQAYSASDALRFVDRALAMGLQIECIEQPVARGDLTALDEVARLSPIPVFADEAVLTPADALRVVEQTHVAGINVKLMKAGVRGALGIASIARASGRLLMIGCMLESRRGIGFALALAAGSGGFAHYDLDSHLLLNEEGANPFFKQDGPQLRPRDHRGSV